MKIGLLNCNQKALSSYLHKLASEVRIGKIQNGSLSEETEWDKLPINTTTYKIEITLSPYKPWIEGNARCKLYKEYELHLKYVGRSRADFNEN